MDGNTNKMTWKIVGFWRACDVICGKNSVFDDFCGGLVSDWQRLREVWVWMTKKKKKGISAQRVSSKALTSTSSAPHLTQQNNHCVGCCDEKVCVCESSNNKAALTLLFVFFCVTMRVNIFKAIHTLRVRHIWLNLAEGKFSNEFIQYFYFVWSTEVWMKRARCRFSLLHWIVHIYWWGLCLMLLVVSFMQKNKARVKHSPG